MEIRLSDVLHRLLLGARALGLVVLVYFVPVVLRDVAGMLRPGGGWLDLLGDDPGAPLLAAAVVIVTFAISAGVVFLYGRSGGPGAARPAPLLRLDRAWASEWGRGLVLGAVLATITVAPALLVGALRIDGFRGVERPDVLALAVIVLILEAAREELAFRGPSQRDLSSAAGFPIAAVFLAGSFTIIHGGNPDIGRSGLLGIFLAGLALAGLVRARGDLGMACGVHAGWNVFLGLVWSVPVSGLRLGSALLDAEPARSAAWTGGSFGAEAGVPAILLFLILGFVAWRLPERAAPSGGDASGDAGRARLD